MSSSIASSHSQASTSSSRSRRSSRFKLDDIRKATNNFDRNSIIGKGEFGVTYKGKLEDGRIVAVKCLDKEANVVEQFRNELDVLSKYRNRHLVSLIGYCQESQEMILVHEFMSNRSLAYHLYEQDANHLSWEQRLVICLDAAKGLEHLHSRISSTKRIIHRNIKPANIMLDDNFAAKIADFGYAKTGPANQTRSAISTEVRGTSGYLDPYYNLTGQLTRRSDTYAFGVVLFEVLCARPAFDERLPQDQQILGRWAQQCFENETVHRIVDGRIRREISRDCLKEYAEVAYSCLLDEPNDRPKMAQVVEKLQSILTKYQQTRPSTRPPRCSKNC